MLTYDFDRQRQQINNMYKRQRKIKKQQRMNKAIKQNVLWVVFSR